MKNIKSFKLFESAKHVLGNRVEYYNDKGELHREDGPAIEWNNGDKFWFLNNALQGINGGPAIEFSDGQKEWWLNGQRHREDGPAIEYATGDKIWYLNDKCHREDGPAIEYADGSVRWYLDGLSYSEFNFISKLTNKKINIHLLKDLPIGDLEELSADLCDKYLGEIKKWHYFYAIYFKDELEKGDTDLKSFENRIKDFRIMVNNKSILIY